MMIILRSCHLQGGVPHETLPTCCDSLLRLVTDNIHNRYRIYRYTYPDIPTMYIYICMEYNLPCTRYVVPVYYTANILCIATPMVQAAIVREYNIIIYNNIIIITVIADLHNGAAATSERNIVGRRFLAGRLRKKKFVHSLQ